MPGEESFNLNLGEMETSELSGYEAAEKFLGGGDGSEVEKIDEQEEAKKAEAEAAKKKAAATKPQETPEQKAAKEKIQKAQADPLAVIEGEDEEEDGEKKDDEELDENGKKKVEAKKKDSEGENEEEESEGGKPNSELNQFEAFSKDLIKIGAFSDLQEGEKLPANPDEFMKKWNEDRQRGAIEWLDDFLTRNGEDRKEIFEAIFINGVEPKDYLSTYAEVQSYKDLDITKEDNQKLVFREFYRRLGWEEPDIEKKLQKTVDYGDLEADSGKFHEQIIKQDTERLEEIQQNEIAKRETQKRIDEQYKIAVQNGLNEALKKKEINGIAINEKIAREAFDFLNTKKYKLPDGQLLTEFDKFVLESKKPENIQQRLLIAILRQTNFDFSSIKKKGVTEETNSLFETVQRGASKKNRESTNKKPASSSKEWLSL